MQKEPITPGQKHQLRRNLLDALGDTKVIGDATESLEKDGALDREGLQRVLRKESRILKAELTPLVELLLRQLSRKYLEPGRRVSVVITTAEETMEVTRCPLVLDGTLRQIFDSVGAAYSKIALTDDQIEKFAIEHPDLLLEEDHATLVLRRRGGKFDVVGMELNDRNRVEINKFSKFSLDNNFVWKASDTHQVLIPTSTVEP